MTNKFTPGPWFAVEYSGFWALQCEPFYSESDDLLNEEKCAKAKENATLAAAAPDLLEALVGVLRVADRKTIEFDAARAAIAKATASKDHTQPNNQKSAAL